MKLIQLATLLIVLFSLHGCGFRDEPDIEIKKAVLYGPDGESEFKQDKEFHILLAANNSTYTVEVSLFPIKGSALLQFYSEGIVIKPNKPYYQLNSGKKNKLNIKIDSISYKNIERFRIISPPTMDYYISDGDGLHVTKKRQKITSKHRKKAKKQTYRYYIPFTLDNKDYAIDITFKLKLKSTPFIGVPGMP